MIIGKFEVEEAWTQAMYGAFEIRVTEISTGSNYPIVLKHSGIDYTYYLVFCCYDIRKAYNDFYNTDEPYTFLDKETAKNNVCLFLNKFNKLKMFI
jgi:hypothetical protein